MHTLTDCAVLKGVQASRFKAEHGIPDFFMPLFGQKTGFRARNAGMNEIKSGIQCSVLKGVQASRVKGRASEPC